MNHFHLRVDYRSASDLSANLDYIARRNGADRLVVLEKKSTNEKDHFHAIFNDDRSESQTRNLWKQKFTDYDGKFKKEYMMELIPNPKRPSLIDAERYLCKGESKEIGPVVAYHTGRFTTEYIAQRHEEYWRIHDDTHPPHLIQSHFDTLGTVISTAVAPPPKKKAPTFLQRLIMRLEDDAPAEYKWDVKRDTPKFLMMLLKAHGKHFKPYGPQQIENEMNVLLNHFCFESHYADFYDVIKNRGNIPHL